MAKNKIHAVNPSDYLFLDVPDTKLGEIINEALNFSRNFPKIIEAIEKDIELAGKNTKFNRLRMRQWEHSQNPDLPWDSLPAVLAPAV